MRAATNTVIFQMIALFNVMRREDLVFAFLLDTGKRKKHTTALNQQLAGLAFESGKFLWCVFSTKEVLILTLLWSDPNANIAFLVKNEGRLFYDLSLCFRFSIRQICHPTIFYRFFFLNGQKR